MNTVFKCFIAVVIISCYTVNTEAMGLCSFQRRFQDQIRKASDCNCKNKTNVTSSSAEVVTQQGGSSKHVPYVELMTSLSRDMTTTAADTTNDPSASVDVVTKEGGSSKRVSYVELMTSSSKDMTTATADFFGASTDPPCLGKIVDEPFVNENCTQRCVCNSTGKLTCSDYSCGDNKTCGVEDGVRDCHCNDGFFRREQHCLRPSGCHDLYMHGIRDHGIYTVYPPGWSNSSMQVYCNMSSWPQDGWTVFQRRFDGSVDFYRNWTEYKNGFGSLDHEFWLGNEALYYLTNQGDCYLRIDVSSDKGRYYMLYSLFRIGNEESGYRLRALGHPHLYGDVGLHDALKYHVNASFSTYDRDNDLNNNGNCAKDNHGGWWFANCSMCNLNGVYGRRQSLGIHWYDLPCGQFNITGSEMKIRYVD